MGTNNLGPMGLVFSRNTNNAAPTYQTNQYTILKTYATKIGLGDVVCTNTSQTGYVNLAADNPGAAGILGVFAGVLPYYDTNLQTTVFIQWWTGTASPSADVGCLVGDDPTVAYRVQVNGGAFAQAWRGQNMNWTASTNGVPNISGISVLTATGTAATTNTFSFRVMGPVGITGGPMDPANSNPWIEVTFNPNVMERLSGTVT